MYNQCNQCYPDTSNDQIKTNKIWFMLPNLTMFSWICKICCASTYHNILLSIFQKSAIMTSKRPWTCLNHGPLQAFHKLFMTWVLPWYLQLDPGLRPWLGGSSSRWKNFGGRMCKQPIPRYPRNHHLSPALGCVARQFLNSSDNSWSKELQLQMWGISYCQRKIHALFRANGS